MLAQKTQALGEDDNCKYRGVDGTACALGCLIPDSLYDKSIEGCAVRGSVLSMDKDVFVPNTDRLTPGDVRFENIISEASGAGTVDHFVFLSELQHIHDAYEPNQWRRKFRALAESHNLQFPDVAKAKTKAKRE